MNLSKYTKMFFLFLTFTIMLTNFYCGKRTEIDNTEKSLAQLDTVGVKTTEAGLNNISLLKTFTGTLEGEDQAKIVSKIPERISTISVRIGDYVKSGQLLISLDKTGASSQYYQAKAGYLNAERELNRMKALLDAGAISQQMYDGTKTAFEIADANFEAAKSTVELTSPINGIVTAIIPNIGEIANPGIPLITIASIGNMKVLFDAGEEDVANFAIGQSAEIYSELKPALIQKGKISQISKSADIQSRSFELRAIFKNTSDRWFKPGMFCRVNVELVNKTNVLSVPNAAVTVRENTKSVYVIKDGKAFMRIVMTGITDGRQTEILSGISQGEIVVTLGANNLKDGSVVHISD